MTVRAFRESDRPALLAMQRGFPYPDLEHSSQLESLRVVVDDEDRPVMAAAAQRLVEVYLWCGSFRRPFAKLHALRLLHEDMACRLKELGYTQAEAFLPPGIAQRFARRLERTFGWTRNWPSWNRGF